MRVLLIRRKEDSQRTAKRLEELGFEPVFFPLFEKVTLKNTPLDKSPDFLIFTSGAGAESVSKEDAQQFYQLPTFAVGPRTAAILESQGYKNIRKGMADANKLAENICNEFGGAAHKGLYFSGVDRAFDMGEALASCGIALEICEVYQITRLVPDMNDFKQVLDGLNGGAILLYSRKSSEHFAELIDASEEIELPEAIHLIGISENTVLPLRKKKVRSIEVSQIANEEGMIKKLKNIPT